MSDDILERAYDLVYKNLVDIKTSKKLVTGISLVENEAQMRGLPIDIMTTRKLVNQSNPNDFQNSIITITEAGIKATNLGIRLYIEKEDAKSDLDYRLKKVQYFPAKYWYVIMAITAYITWITSKC